MYLVDASGNEVAAYDYDPYGKILSATGSMAEVNPLRYRGYYYDTETGFYYLQSRYYDPEICRFINADSYASTGQEFAGYNMFAYCNNNSVNRIDWDGHDASVLEWWSSTMWWLCAIDGPYPIGDIIYGIGIAALTVEYFVTSSKTTEPIILLEEDNNQSSPPSPPVPSSNGSHNNKNNKSNKNKLSLKRVTEYLLKKRGLDAHKIKYEYLGSRAQVRRYDLFYDSKTGIIYILSKAGEIICETCYNIYKDILLW